MNRTADHPLPSLLRSRSGRRSRLIAPGWLALALLGPGGLAAAGPAVPRQEPAPRSAPSRDLPPWQGQWQSAPAPPPGAVLAPVDLALGGQGGLLVADRELGRLQRFSRQGAVEQVYSLPEGPFADLMGVAADPARERVYASDADRGLVAVFAADGQLLERWTDFQRPEALALGEGGRLHVYDRGRSAIVTRTPEGREAMDNIPVQVPQVSGGELPNGLAVDGAGQIWFAAEAPVATMRPVLYVFSREGDIVPPRTLLNFNPRDLGFEAGGQGYLLDGQGARLVLDLDRRRGSYRALAGPRGAVALTAGQEAGQAWLLQAPAGDQEGGLIALRPEGERVEQAAEWRFPPLPAGWLRRPRFLDAAGPSLCLSDDSHRVQWLDGEGRGQAQARRPHAAAVLGLPDGDCILARVRQASSLDDALDPDVAAMGTQRLSLERLRRRGAALERVWLKDWSEPLDADPPSSLSALAQGPEGSLLVLDASGHRIRRFSLADGAEQGELTLPDVSGFAPWNDLAQAPDGSIWVLDVLAPRLWHLDAAGTVLDQVPAPAGALRLALLADGDLLVLSTQRRLLRLAPDGRVLAQQDLPRAGKDEPQPPADLTVDEAGRILVADPAAAAVHRFAAAASPPRLSLPWLAAGAAAGPATAGLSDRADRPVEGPVDAGPFRRLLPPFGPDFRGHGQESLPQLRLRPDKAAPAPLRARQAAPELLPENVQVSRTGQVAGASRPVTDYSEVHLAASPLDPDHLLGSSKFFYDPPNYGFYTGVFESLDGGASWSQEQPLGIELYSLTSDPVNTFDHQGNGYFTLLTRGPTGLDMLKKPRGKPWEGPVVVDRSTVTDKQWIAGDQDLAETSRFPGRLYMSWTDVANPSRILFAHSADGNKTWSGPLELDRGNLQGSQVAVGPDGTVYVLYGRDIFGGQGALLVTRSADGGLSFAPPVQVAPVSSIPFRLDDDSDFRTPASLPAFAVSPKTGTLAAAWADFATGDADILLALSRDGGRTWTEPTRINDDPVASGIDQIQPQLAAGPDGRLAVAWLDRRHYCPDLPFIPLAHVGREDFCLDVYLSRSTDDGASWSPNLRVSAQTWDWTLSLPRDGSGNGFIGDYIGLAATRDFDYPFWASNADLGLNGEHRQQVFTARVPASPLPVDLAPTSLTVSPAVQAPGQEVTVLLRLENRGQASASRLTADQPLPEGLALVDGSAAATAGLLNWDAAARTLRWEGPLAAGAATEIRFRAVIPADAAEGSRLALLADIHDDEGRRYLRHASATVSLPPRLIRAVPADGSTEVGAGTAVILSFSEPMDPFRVDLNTEPGLGEGAWEQPVWSRDAKTVTFRHSTPFSPGLRYRLTVTALDPSGLSLVPGPVPNPWSFTIEGAAPRPPTLVLPWLNKP